MALQNYQEDYGSFPPACLIDEQGTPIHSWRVSLLPYLDEQALFDDYRFDEPWNGPNNRRLAARIPHCYQCPSHGHHGKVAGKSVTNYVAVVDPHGIFRGDQPTTTSDTTGGESRAIVVVDVNQQSVNWLAPDDMTGVDFLALFREHSEFNHPGGTVVALADGTVRFLSRETKPQVVKALLTNQPNDHTQFDGH